MLLPDKLILRVLSEDTLNESGGRNRLSYALVCKQWCRLVPKASCCLVVHLKTAQQADTFAAYVAKHGQHLKDLTVTTVLAEDCPDLWPALRRLLCRLNDIREPAQLTRLALFCDCSDADAALLSGLPQTVQDLDLGLSRTNISCRSINHFAALSNLVKLDLSHSCMDNTGLQVLAREMPRLQDLKLGYCVPGVTISGLMAVSGLTMLTSLYCPTLTAAKADSRTAPSVTGPTGSSSTLVSSWSVESHASWTGSASGRQQQLLEGLVQQSLEKKQAGHQRPADLWQPHSPNLPVPDELSTTCEQCVANVGALQTLPHSLQELNLRGHAIGVQGVSALVGSAAASSLTWLCLAVCSLGDADVAPLAGLSALEVLDLSSNVISMTGVTRLLSAALPLCTLDVSLNRISDSSLELDNADQATSAAAGTADISSSSPAAGHILLGHLGDAAVHAAVEPAIYNSTFSAVAASLQGLNLTHSSLGQRGIRPLVPLQLLKHLNISSCSITDRGLAGLGQLSSLQWLNLAHNDGITAMKGLLGELSQLTRLQQLILGSIGMQESDIDKVLLLLGNKQIATAAARHAEVAEAAVLHTPSCGVLSEGGCDWPDSVLVLALHEPLGGIRVGQQVLEAASRSSLVGAFASPPGAVVVLGHQLPLRPRRLPDSRGRIEVDSTHELHDLHAVNSHESAELDLEVLLPQVFSALFEQTLPA